MPGENKDPIDSTMIILNLKRQASNYCISVTVKADL